MRLYPSALLTVTAATYSEAGAEDNFDGTSLDDTKWNVINNAGGEISQYVMPGTLKMIKMPAGSSIVTKEKVGADGKGLIFEFDLIAYENAGLIRILKGMDAQTPAAEDLNDSYLQNAGDVRSTRGDWKPFARYNLNQTTWLDANSWASIGFSKIGSRYQFVFNSDGSFTLNTKIIGDDDSTYVKQIETSATDVENQWANAKFTKTGSGYAGFYFESANGSLVIDNVNIKAQDDSSVFTDDFEYFNLDTEKWTASAGIIGGFGKSLRFYNIDNNGLGKSTAAQLVSKSNIVNLLTAGDVSAQIVFKLKVNQLFKGSVGISFGLTGETGFNESTSRFSVMFKDNDANLNLSALKDGTAFGGDIDLGALTAYADYVPVKFIIKNNGVNQTLDVYVNNSLVKTYGFQKLAGFIAFSETAGTYEHVITPEIPAVLDNPETTEIDESSPLVPAVTETRNGLINVEIDDFKVSYTKYSVAEGKALVNKFESNDLGDDWYLTSIGLGGAGADDKPLPEGWGVNIKDGKLVFNNASDGSYFGPNKKYGNFDLTFDVSDIGYADIMDEEDNYIMMKSQFLGITFGREALDTQYHGGNGFANTLFLDHNPWGGTDGTATGAELGRLYLAQGSAGNLTDFVYNFANPWTQENQERGALTVRVKVVDGSLNVYLRYADEPASKLDIPVLSAQVDSRIGYVALTCTEPTYYSIDNFSIKNIDQTGVTEDTVIPCPNPADHDNVCPNPSDHDNVCPDPSAHTVPVSKGCNSNAAAVSSFIILAAGAIVMIKKR